MLGETLVQLEITTDDLMRNAVRVVQTEFEAGKLPSTDRLRKLRDSLGVSHLFVIDHSGKFVRSTNEDPDLIPNFFSFCPSYRDLLSPSSRSSHSATPIIPPYPETHPFKFLSAPTKSGYIVEAGIRAQFIGDILTRLLKEDANVVSLELFAPNGTSLGHFGREALNYERRVDTGLDVSGTKVVETEQELVVSSIARTPHEQCCQCDVSKISKDGKYFYILKARISKAELNAALGQITGAFILAEGLLLLASVVASLIVARALARRLNTLADAVSRTASTGPASARFDVDGKDEISTIASGLNGMLERLAQAEQSRLEAAKQESVLAIAKQVAHDIRSPLTALNVFLKACRELPEPHRLLARSAVERIMDIANNLSAAGNPSIKESVKAKESPRAELISCLVSEIVSEKRTQFSGESGVTLTFEVSEAASVLFARVDPSELKRSISNVLNNAFEAMSGKSGAIIASVLEKRDSVRIEIADQGKGMPPEIVQQALSLGISHDKAGGQGLGLRFARECMIRAGGRLEIESSINIGTVVSLELPVCPAPAWFSRVLMAPEGATFVALDDDSTIHRLWDQRYPALKHRLGLKSIVHLASANEFDAWVHANDSHLVVYSIDHELGSGSLDGAGLIEKHRLQDRSILLTSHWSSPELRSRCERTGIRMFPKFSAHMFDLKTARAPYKPSLMTDSVIH